MTVLNQFFCVLGSGKYYWKGKLLFHLMDNLIVCHSFSHYEPDLHVVLSQKGESVKKMREEVRSSVLSSIPLVR